MLTTGRVCRKNKPSPVCALPGTLGNDVKVRVEADSTTRVKHCSTMEEVTCS